MKLQTILLMLLVLLTLARAQDSIPIPHGIDGYILNSDSSQATAGTHFSINDTNSGFFVQGQSGIGPFSGKYSVAVTGSDGDIIIIKAWVGQNIATRVVTLSGAMHDINLMLPNGNPNSSNLAPYFTTTPLLNAVSGTNYLYEARAADPETQPITYTLASAPNGASIEPNGNLHWTAGAQGKYDFAISASDAQSATTQTFELTVTSGQNSIPAINSLPQTTAMTGQLYQYQVSATDADNDALSYSLLESPSGMSISSSGLVTWTAQNAGSYVVNLAVVDAKGASATQNFIISVGQSANSAPTIISSAPTSATTGTTYSYYVDGQDAQGDTLNYSLPEKPAGMSINQNGLITWQPSTPGSFFVIVMATDSHGLSATQAFTINVVQGSSSGFTINGLVVDSNSQPSGHVTIIANNSFATYQVLSGNATHKNSFSISLSASTGDVVKLRAFNSTHEGLGQITLTSQITNAMIEIRPQNTTQITVASIPENKTQKTINFQRRTSDVAITQVDSEESGSITIGMTSPQNPFDKKVLQYLSSNTTMPFAKFTFKVPKEWITSNDIDAFSIKLYKYEARWTVQPTWRLAEDSQNYYFESTVSPQGIFAIAADANAALQGAPIDSAFSIEGRLVATNNQNLDNIKIKLTNTRTKEEFETITGSKNSSGYFSAVVTGRLGDEILIDVDGAKYSYIIGGGEGALELVYNKARQSLVPITGALAANSNPPKIGLAALGILIGILGIASILAGASMALKLREPKKNTEVKKTEVKQEVSIIKTEPTPEKKSAEPKIEIRSESVKNTAPIEQKPITIAKQIETPRIIKEERIDAKPKPIRMISPSQFFYLVDGSVLTSKTELYLALGKMDQKTFSHHVNESKNDFASWIEGIFSDKEMAKSLRNAKTKEEMRRALR